MKPDEDLTAPVAPTPTIPTEAQVNTALHAETEAIQDGDVLEKFLNEPVVKETFAALGKRYYGEFIAASSPELRDEVWAKSKALLDLAKELRAVYSRGFSAKHARRTRAALERGNERRRPRRGS